MTEAAPYRRVRGGESDGPYFDHLAAAGSPSEACKRAQASGYDTRVDLGDFGSTLRRNREERRRLLKRNERFVGWTLALAPSILVVVGVLVLLNGSSRALGIGLLLVGLVVIAVPVSPLLRARVRRREARAGRGRQTLG
jgi:hypothetical protein